MHWLFLWGWSLFSGLPNCAADWGQDVYHVLLGLVVQLYHRLKLTSSVLWLLFLPLLDVYLMLVNSQTLLGLHQSQLYRSQQYCLHLFRIAYSTVRHFPASSCLVVHLPCFSVVRSLMRYASMLSLPFPFLLPFHLCPIFRLVSL